MNLRQLLMLKAAGAGGGSNVNLPGYFSAIGSAGTFTPQMTNNYGTTISTTSAEGNSVTVTQVYNSDEPATSYKNGYIAIGFDKMNEWLESGSPIEFTADISVTENPASVSSLNVIINTKQKSASIAEGKLTAQFDDATASTKHYVELRCEGCSFTLSNAKLKKL